MERDSLTTTSDWKRALQLDRALLGELAQFSLWFLALGLGLGLGMWLYFLTAGVLLQLLLLLAAGGAWLLAAWRRRAAAATVLDGPLLAFFMVAALACYFSLDPGRSWRVVWYWACYAVLLYAATAAFRGGWSPRVAARALLLVAGLLILAAYLQVGQQVGAWREALGWLAPLPPRLVRVWGVTDNPNTLGILLAMVLPYALAYRRHAGGSGRIWPWLWLLLAIPVVLLTRSRGGLLAAGAGLILFWQRDLLIRLQAGALTRRQLLRRVAAIAAVVLLSGAVIVVLRPSTLSLSGDSTMGKRLLYWEVAVDILRARPWLGAGPFTFASFYLQRVAVPFGELIDMPHNVVFSLLSMMGIAGLAAGTWVLIELLRRCRRVNLAAWSDWQWAALASLGGLFAYWQFDIILVRPAVLITAALSLAILLAGLPAPRRGRWTTALWTLLWALLLATGIRDWDAARQYDAGVAAAENGDWSAAAAAFEQGEAGALDSTAFLYAAALSRGMAAAEDPGALPAAITAYEALVIREPGWTASHANLAALYQESGRWEAAAAALQPALDGAPDVGAFWLNAALWATERGDGAAAADAYWSGFAVDSTWHGAALWADALPGNRPVPDSRTEPPLLAAGQAALMDGDYAAATLHFTDFIAASPTDSRGYLGLGIATLFTGTDGAASQLAYAAALDAGTGGRSSRPYVPLWNAVATADPIDFAAQLDQLIAAPVFGSRRGAANYPFLRRPLPVELLPQLSCFVVSDTTAWHLELAARWQVERGDSALAESVDAALRGDGRGLHACSR